MLAQFPFEILGFHADNGSEYVNHRVAKMLDKLRIEFTRSRPRHSNDNGLAEPRTGPWCARSSPLFAASTAAMPIASDTYLPRFLDVDAAICPPNCPTPRSQGASSRCTGPGTR